MDHLLDNHNFRVDLFDWKPGPYPAISQYYNKLKGEAISYFSLIIPTTVATCLTLCFINLLVVLLSMMHTCWCPLALNILLLSLKYFCLFENQIRHLIFLLKIPSVDHLLLHNTLTT